jgi:uncharacterized protein YxeA
MKKLITGILSSLLFFVVGGFIVFTMVTQKVETDKIMKEGVNTVATPDRVESDTSTRSTGTGSNRRSHTGTDYNAIFTYEVNERTYSVRSKNFSSNFDAEDYLNSHDTVRYLEEDPSKSRILD